jgi:cobalt-zinc-cadmium efflux system protein
MSAHEQRHEPDRGSYDHADHGHHHHDLRGAEERTLKITFAMIVAFMGLEAVVGWMANSLTLVADAGHMFLDASSLGLAWYAVRLSHRDTDSHLSYGYHRFQVLAAFVNGLSLLALCTWIVIQAVVRLGAPQPMIAGPALAVAVGGLIVNLAALRMLRNTAAASLNIRAAVLHVIGDLLGSVAAIAAAATVLFLGWPYADPILAFVVVAILLRGAISVIIEAGHILLEGVPHHLDLEQIKQRLTERVSSVVEIHHVHAWALTTERPLLTLHATVTEGTDAHVIVGRIKDVLLKDFGIDHSTIQVEQGPCPDSDHHH